MPTLKERRKAPRSPSRVPLDIYNAKGRAMVGDGRCVDLSVLGARIASKKPLKAKSTIRLRLAPLDKPIFTIAGKVIWMRKKAPGFEYGICFSSQPLEPLS